jgi:hypothetical protein
MITLATTFFSTKKRFFGMLTKMILSSVFFAVSEERGFFLLIHDLSATSILPFEALHTIIPELFILSSLLFSLYTIIRAFPEFF